MSKILINHSGNHISPEIKLRGSKSESNRILMIRTLIQSDLKINNLSTAKDTVTFDKLCKNLFNEKEFNIGHAGTAMRFATALFSITPGERILTGSERMQNRPIGELVSALRQIGANITYLEKEGYPPLKIAGKKLIGGKIELNPSISSQFVSALCMIAPRLSSGLEITFKSKPVSVPYIDMTLALMKQFDAKGIRTEKAITIPETGYHTNENSFTVESDWSSASYWYAIAALAPSCEIHLSSLKTESNQGDSILPVIYEKLGVTSERLTKDIIVLRKNGTLVPEIELNLESSPDIAQTILCTAAGLGIRAKLSGLSTLRVKETDRLQAMKNELEKFGCEITIHGNEAIHLKPASLLHAPTSPVETYEDHRMAMAFAPLALVCNQLEILNPTVVEKSYPEFWEDLQKAGFLIHF